MSKTINNQAGERTQPVKKEIYYYVKVAGSGGSFAPDWSLTRDGRTWTKAACKEQIKKLRKHVYDGRKLYADAPLVIIRETRIMEVA